MDDNYFNKITDSVYRRFNLDLIKDVIVSRKNEIILLGEIIENNDVILELVSGSLTIIGFDEVTRIRLSDIFKALDNRNAFALVAGDREYFQNVKEEILAFDTLPNVTFPVRLNNQKHWMKINIIPIEDHDNLLTVFITNVSDYLIEEEAMYFKTHHDSLTGVFNKYTLDYHYGLRYQFDDFHVLFLDLDNFKRLNDELGHEAGNQFLRDFSDILKSHQSNYDRFYRIGGDEFVGLFFGDTSSILNKADDIIKRTHKLSNLYKYADISVSIGVVKADERDDVIRKADKLLYKAKSLGKNQYVYDEEKNICNDKQS